MPSLTANPTFMLVVYCGLVLVASLVGGWVPLLIRLTHARLQVAVSLVAGVMLGTGLLHLLPDAAEQLSSVDRAMIWVLGGFLTMFFLQRFFYFHHHDLPGDSRDEHGLEHEGHGDTPPPGRRDSRADGSARQLTWVGTALGMTLHSLLGGLALAAGVAAGVAGHHRIIGLGIALVIILHKPFDAMAITTLMSAGETARPLRHLLNALFALVTPLGVLLFYLGANQFTQANQAFVGCALAFAAGTFLCVACSDLLPELQFHSHDRFKLSVALLAGLGVAVLIGRIEAASREPPRSDATPPGALAGTWEGGLLTPPRLIGRQKTPPPTGTVRGRLAVVLKAGADTDGRLLPKHSPERRGKLAAPRRAAREAPT